MNALFRVFPILLGMMVTPLHAGDRDALIGTWEITVFLDDGNDRLARLGAGAAKKGKGPRIAKLVFTEDACFVLRGDGKRDVLSGLTNAAWKKVTLHPDKSPKEIEITGFAGKDGSKEKVYPGIYDISDGKLKICWAESGSDKPTEFISNGHFNLFECKRISEEPEDLP